MGDLKEKYQNDVLHGNMNMAPLNECRYNFPASFKMSICTNMYQ